MLHYADICHLDKIRYLHLHLADNGGYCLPSRKFPKLPTPGKSFSFEQIEILKRYCAARNIEIIPEIDVPGHTSYLNTAYPEFFSDSPAEGEARKDLICIGKPGMLENLRELFREVMEMFPDSRYFHIGGDEAAIDAWNDCADCTAYRKKHGIADVKALYTHSIKIITDMVLELGKIPVVWEGFPKDSAEQISRKVIVTAWESLYHLPNELIEEGFTITNSSWMPLYVVHPQSYHAQFVKGGRWHPEDILSDWNIYTWKNWWEKSAAYEKPIVVDPTDQVIGATYCVWLTDYEIELPAVLENLPAMCERLWNINSTLSPEEYAAGLCCLASLAEKLKP
jgi:hexosaminidase